MKKPICINTCPDFWLIETANTTKDESLRFAIDLELEQRYEEIKEELEEYEKFMNC
jgi:hypothetical protein